MHASFGVFALLALTVSSNQPTAAPTATQVPAKKIPDEWTMTISVNAGGKECFFVSLVDEKFQGMAINYQVIDGGHLDVNFVLRSPTGHVVEEDQRSPSAEHKVLIDDRNHRGDYEFCFDNSFSFNSKKMLYFEVMLLDHEGSYSSMFERVLESEKVMTETMKNFDSITAKVKNNLNSIERDQAALRVLESRDRSQMENSFEKINTFGILISITIIVGSLGQVFLVRRLFNQ
ncbi:hypothetical protein L596_015512 [Steinernema carpocapsae]|uniref:GOLD domain-containing protein n=1 Tax=Steinernema carpocapsae TaxID=34508 RepID=A0A4U5NF72_STECR|nr:hypothetical protein L596_015512 [Steinernema carpocapsae]